MTGLHRPPRARSCACGQNVEGLSKYLLERSWTMGQAYMTTRSLAT